MDEAISLAPDFQKVRNRFRQIGILTDKRRHMAPEVVAKHFEEGIGIISVPLEPGMKLATNRLVLNERWDQ